jgi:hypothetical protein
MDQQKLVIFVGYVLKSNLDIFLKEGYAVGLFQDTDNPQIGEKFETEILPFLSFVVPLQFDNKSLLLKSLKLFYFNPKTLLVCVRDRYFYPMVQVAHILGLDQAKSMSIEVARNMTNKHFQRREFAKYYPEISPASKKISNFHGAYTFAHKYGFPVIVKPANLSQGQLVNICNNLEELVQKVSYVLDHVEEVYEEQHVYRKPQVIVEQFIKGRQFSVDSYVDFKGNIVHTPVCHQVISHDLGDDDFETYYSEYSSGLTEKEERLIFDTVSKAIKSLKIKGSPTHIEVKLTPEGKCQVIEVNVRTGGYRAEMLRESYDIDHIKNVINTYLGRPVSTNTKLLKYSACPQFWAEEEGIVTEIQGREEVEKLASFVQFKKHGVGQERGPVSKGYPRIANAILAHEEKSVLVQDLVTIRKIVKTTIE